jgi:hypothetical protein
MNLVQSKIVEITPNRKKYKPFYCCAVLAKMNTLDLQ